MVLTSSIDNQHGCASWSNYILMIFGFEWVVWIHRHKFLWSVAANNHIPCKLQLDLITARLIYYSHVDIFYCWMKCERHTLPWTTGNFFLAFILKDIFYQTSPSPNGVVERRDMDHMGFSKPMSSCRKRISWYLWVQNTNRKELLREQIQCIFIGRNNISCIFS